MNRTTFAKIISLIFDPVVSLTFLILLLITNSGINQDNMIFILLSMFIFFLFVPFLVVLIFLKEGWVSDIEIDQRAQRIYVEIAILICWSCGLLFLLNIGEKSLLKSFIILFVEFILTFLINLKTKISLHSSIFVTSILILALSIHIFYLLGFLVVPLIMWARINLKHHTLFQTVIGIIVPSILIPVLWLILF